MFNFTHRVHAASQLRPNGVLFPMILTALLNAEQVAYALLVVFLPKLECVRPAL